jgi:ELWxxDGT repeat protein
MKSWRGVPVLVSVLSGLVVACGPVPQGEVEAVDGVAPVRESEAAVGTVTAEGLVPLPGPGWDVCEDSARRVRDINPGPASSSPNELVEANGRLFFVATDPEHGRELWMSQGPGRPTSLVMDVNPGLGHSVPRALTVMGRWVFFVADDGAHGVELWRTDGTARSTELVKDVRPGVAGALPDKLTVVGGTLYFTANDGPHGRELWRTDGTERGTELAYEFAPGPGSVEFDRLLTWEHDLALVVYDGTTRTTTLWDVDERGHVGALFTLGDGVFLELEPAGRQLFFTVNPGTDESDLWVTRNAPDTATWLRHFAGQEPKSLTAMGDAVYFAAGGEGYWGDVGDPRHGSELWRSDGTVWGTRLVRDINPGEEGAFSPFLAPGFVVVDRTLYFAADDGWFGRELWRSDGTLLGTWMVADLEPGHGGSDPQDLAVDTGWLFFSATTSGHGSEPWFSGGRSWNTHSLTDIAPGIAYSNPKGFVRADWNVFFAATDGAGDQELWSVSFRPVRSCGARAF